ncbi:MAG: hypothetical protein WD009_07715 [Phycisphaeraceae bacterium]
MVRADTPHEQQPQHELRGAGPSPPPPSSPQATVEAWSRPPRESDGQAVSGSAHTGAAGAEADAADRASQGDRSRMARQAQHSDLLYDNLHLAFPRMRSFWRDADPWTRQAYERFRRAQGGGRANGGMLRRFVVYPLSRMLYPPPARWDGGANGGAMRDGNGQADQRGLAGEINRLSQAVKDLQQSITQMASRPMVVEGGPARNLRFSHRSRSQRSEQHSAVLKEIFETNVELRRAIREGRQASEPSEQAA